MISLKNPANGTTVCLQTSVQRDFINEEERRAEMDSSQSFCWYNLERKGVDCTAPLPVSFAWEESNSDVDAHYYLLISEKADMSDSWVYITKDLSCEVYNLKVGAKYFWCVQKNGKRSEVFSFETRLTLPRCLKIEKISNVRDIGGYKVAGGQIRQGLVYRGGEFETHMQLEPLGAQELCRLGIRTDLDMRGEAAENVESATSACIGIRRVFVPSVPYAHVFEKEQRAAIKNFFKVFTNDKNYPIYFHCWGGADRTGTFAFVLGALLGMSYNDLIYEYEFTSLSIWGPRSRNHYEFKDFLKLFMALLGNTLHEKSKSFLKKQAGLTDKQISKIYNILVEKDNCGS